MLDGSALRADGWQQWGGSEWIHGSPLAVQAPTAINNVLTLATLHT